MKIGWILALLLTSVPAAADPGEERSEEDADDEVMMIPPACHRLVPVDQTQETFWDRWLSLAACMQDEAIGASMRLYSEALQRAPKTIQFRAAYHVGLASVAMMTRARRSMGAGRDEVKLRDDLEWRLEPIKQMARVALGAALKGAELDPAVAADPVGRNMVRSASVLLSALGESRADQLVARAND